MKTSLSRLALATVVGLCSSSVSRAAVLSGWTFEVNTPADVTNSATGPSVVAETGIYTTGFTAQGAHATANSDWSTPSGNVSANSYSANEWTTGSTGTNYFQYTTSSIDHFDITINFDHISSGTGMRDFEIFYSTDGTNFVTTGYTYLVVQNSNVGTNGVSFGTWNSTIAIPESSYVADLSNLSALDNQATLFFRFVSTSTTSPSGGVGANTGTSRMDNVTINAVPEPTAAVLGGLGLLGLLRRRR